MPNNGIHNLTEENLSHFYGSQSYMNHRTKKVVMTDGVQFVDNNNCGWLIDIIASHQSDSLQKKSKGFQFWKLRKIENDPKFMAVVTCEDGNYRPLVEQKVPFTDFPFDRLLEGLDFYVEFGSVDGVNPCWVCMLTSER